LQRQLEQGEEKGECRGRRKWEGRETIEGGKEGRTKKKKPSLWRIFRKEAPLEDGDNAH